MVFQEGRSVAANSTSGLVKIVRKLRNNPDLSKRIMQAAIEASLPKRRSAAVVEVIDIDLDATETSDFELEDNEWFAELPEGLFSTFLSLERSSTQIRTSFADVRFGLEEEEEDWVQDRFETF
ncbi:hypothetical protein DFH08DRAFT_1081881 [Mycena albidolilacea]|uniref:Uncharacterized protein n=1 Tax=Mycena albidolilacea TaxID=1033008 RepID=A0AAD7EQD5_9AGAR|nr:hypothetical protein DFH08DRAFT_1081881 [Mycena albidolilacea]